jgi:hypothetical protein
MQQPACPERTRETARTQAESLASRLPLPSRMGDQNIVRKEFPTADPECAIHVTTERLADGWAVVSSIRHRTEGGEQVTDLPVPDRTFDSQAAAEDFGARMAMEWLDRNAPRSDAA